MQSLTTTRRNDGRLADSTLINSYRMFMRARRDGGAYVRLARNVCVRMHVSTASLPYIRENYEEAMTIFILNCLVSAKL